MNMAGNGGSSAGHILLVEGNGGKRRSLSFVLGLAGYRVTPVRTPYEALDWAMKRQGTPERFFALVIGTLTGTHDAAWLVNRLERAGWTTPILIVSDEDPLVAETGGAVIACRPEEVAGHLDLLTGRE